MMENGNWTRNLVSATNRVRLTLKFAVKILFVVQLLLTGCSRLTDGSLMATFTPTFTPRPTATSTYTPTVTPTPTLTPTPAVVILKTPTPRDLTAREPTPAGDLIAHSKHLDFYAQPDNYWAQHIIDVGTAIEVELEQVARRLQTDLPDERIAISIQDPSTSPLVRGMNCPARGLYYGRTMQGPLLAIFADEHTTRVQVLAVAAHELAHHLTFEKFGHGGDLLLSEGLANWASRATWSQWQGWPSFTVAVLDYRQRGIFLPLEETLVFDPSVEAQLGLGDCFEVRDLRYNEWASFVEFLIQRHGLETIAELWGTQLEEPRPFRRSRGLQSSPTVDYAGILGKDLQELERDWLEHLYLVNAE